MATGRIKVGFAFGLIIGVIFWLLFTGINDNMQYFRTVKELKAMNSEALKYGLRVKGMLVPGSLKTNPENLDVSFLIEDGGEQLEVRYSGELPDTFRDGSEVLVEGHMTSEGYFQAQTVKAKCASKYESDEWYDMKNYDPKTHQIRQNVD
ncbi:MAG: cytochrome c maturation protein CcmE [Calditrichaeota bacterium]|nr:MAG: cytochrome c maturation protein CcmE [Calditrichota bacterium]